MSTISRLRRIGGSIGILIPKGEISALGLHVGDEVQVVLIRKVDLRRAFGSLKGLPHMTQKKERELDSGWD